MRIHDDETPIYQALTWWNLHLSTLFVIFCFFLHIPGCHIFGLLDTLKPYTPWFVCVVLDVLLQFPLFIFFQHSYLALDVDLLHRSLLFCHQIPSKNPSVLLAHFSEVYSLVEISRCSCMAATVTTRS